MFGSISSSTGGISNALVEIQNRALDAFQNQGKPAESKTSSTDNNNSKRVQAKSDSEKSNNQSGTLSQAEERDVAKLKSRDAEVRAHEQAHMAAGGSLIRGGASYSYATGPDDKRYAVGGEVSIDTSPIKDDPKATIMKEERVKRAAMAPAKPSSQDYAVASSAQQLIIQAQMELSKNQTSTSSNEGEEQSTRNIQKINATNAYSGLPAVTPGMTANVSV
jgi:hypothetical protein